MTEFDPSLMGPAAFTVFFYGSIVAMICFGTYVSWVRSAPQRREARRLAMLRQITGR